MTIYDHRLVASLDRGAVPPAGASDEWLLYARYRRSFVGCSTPRMERSSAAITQEGLLRRRGDN